MSAGINALEEHEFFTSLPEDHPLIAASASGIHVSAIAEHSVSTTIALFHQLHRVIIAGHNQQKWVNARQEFGGGSNFIRELRDQTVGIIGSVQAGTAGGGGGMWRVAGAAEGLGRLKGADG